MEVRILLALPLLALLACGDSLSPEEEDASCQGAEWQASPGTQAAPGVAVPLDAAEQAYALDYGEKVRTTPEPVEGVYGPGSRTHTLLWTNGIDLPLVGNAAFQQVLGNRYFARKASRHVIATAP